MGQSTLLSPPLLIPSRTTAASPCALRCPNPGGNTFPEPGTHTEQTQLAPSPGSSPRPRRARCGSRAGHQALSGHLGGEIWGERLRGAEQGGPGRSRGQGMENKPQAPVQSLTQALRGSPGLPPLSFQYCHPHSCWVTPSVWFQFSEEKNKTTLLSPGIVQKGEVPNFMDRKTEAQWKKTTCPQPPGANQRPASPPQPHHKHLPDHAAQPAVGLFWFFLFFLLISHVKLPTARSVSEKTTKGTTENKVKVQIPEKKKKQTNSRSGKRFLETLFGVLLATRLCLPHAWPRPHGPLPHRTGHPPVLPRQTPLGSGPAPCTLPHPTPAGQGQGPPAEETSPIKHSRLVSVKNRGR
nr:uncharacterized protein LOC106046107 [Anser cygnoides]